MKDSKQIKEELEELMESLDKLVPDWAEAKANREKMDELKKVTLATIASHLEGGSEAERTRKSLTSKRYLEYVETSANASLEFYKLDGKKTLAEKKIEVLRSLLSHDKSMVQNLT